MKKILYLVFTAVIATSCSKDADVNKGITGNWKTNIIISAFYIDSQFFGADTSTTGGVIFTTDGNFISTDGSTDSTKGVYTYNSSAQQLLLIANGDSLNLTVTNLTNGNLHIKGDNTYLDNNVAYRTTVDGDYSR